MNTYMRSSAVLFDTYRPLYSKAHYTDRSKQLASPHSC